jgi:DNA-binding protein HU-beta
LPKAKVAAVLDVLRQTIVEKVRAGEGVALRGLFSVKPQARGETTARNPRTGEKIAVPAKTVAKFKAGFEV